MAQLRAKNIRLKIKQKPLLSIVLSRLAFTRYNNLTQNTMSGTDTDE